MIVLAYAGVRQFRPPRAGVDLLLWIAAYVTFIHLVFFSIFRYSLPVYAYLFAFSGAGALWVLRVAGRMSPLRVSGQGDSTER
jgi:hypothetical protein